MILAGAALAGFVQGLSGFALGLVATVFWSAALPPQVAAPLIVLCSIAGQLLGIRSVLPNLGLRRAAPMVLAGLAGVPLGIMLLPAIDAGFFRFWIGVMLCAYCPAMLLSRRLPTVTRGGHWADAAAGALGGIMGGLAGLSGPVPTLWCTLRGWDRDIQRGTIQLFLIAVQLMGLLGYATAGLLTPDVWRLAAWTVPSALLPALLGIAMYKRLGGEAFRRLVLTLLALTGVTLVVQGL